MQETEKRFIVFVRVKGSKSEPWAEEYQRDVDDPERWARETIACFNNTLRSGEQPRELVRIEMLDATAAPKEHSWEKTNLVTKEHAGRIFDVYKCRRCGITAKRHTVGVIVRDSKFRAFVYRQCDTTITHLNRSPSTAAPDPEN